MGLAAAVAAAAVIAAAVVAAAVAAAAEPSAAATAAEQEQDDDENPRTTVVTHLVTPPFVYIPYYSLGRKWFRQREIFYKTELCRDNKRKREEKPALPGWAAAFDFI